MNSILLSAGLGTRFKPYTLSKAKPAIPFLGLPYIGYSLYYAKKFNVEGVVINTHHLPNTIIDCVNIINERLKLKITFVDEQPNILDSGGGIKNAQNLLQDSECFFVFNTDAPHVLPDINVTEVIERHKNSNALCTVFTCNTNNHNNTRGIWTKKNENLVLIFNIRGQHSL